MTNENNDALTAFTNLVMQCAAEPEFVKQFNRLAECNLGQSLNRTAIDAMIDAATGYSGESEDDMMKFVRFVYEFVWLRLPRNDGQPALSGGVDIAVTTE